MKVVAITGPMRSGTSLVAAVVHRLGFAVAPYIPAPVPPQWRSDWEDPDLSVKLMLRQRIRWDEYIKRRKRMAAALGFRGVAIKSPYLALYLGDLETRVQHLIFTRRDPALISASMKRSPQLSEDDQCDIVGALLECHINPDITLECEEMRADPFLAVEDICRVLDVHDETLRPLDIIEPLEASWPQSSLL